MPRDTFNLSRREEFSISTSFPPLKNRPQHVVYAVMRDNKHQPRDVDHSNLEILGANGRQ